MKNEVVNKLHMDFKQKKLTKTLHILNGMAMANYFRENNLEDSLSTYIPFNEAVCWGKVNADIFSPEFIRVRAESLKSTEEMYRSIVMDNLKPLFDENFDIIVLWFGDDMFCQMNLVTMLAYLDQINFEGDIFLSMVEEQRDEILPEAIEISCNGYKEIYETILINKDRYDGQLLPVTYQGMNLYLDYRDKNGEIYRYINNNLADEGLVFKLLKLFPQYGLGDLQYKWIIEEIKAN